MQGCVNKTSLFDKDLIFLCIFGLRGDKHELESQIGLRCASKLRRDLLAMRGVKSVTVAVTTGMTYCGVVGHILRREYTVIGMSVNKAARLMVAYNNKVIDSYERDNSRCLIYAFYIERKLESVSLMRNVVQIESGKSIIFQK